MIVRHEPGLVPCLATAIPISCGTGAVGSTVGAPKFYRSLYGGILYSITVTEPTKIIIDSCGANILETQTIVTNESFSILCQDTNYNCDRQYNYLSCNIPAGTSLIIASVLNTEDDLEIHVGCVQNGFSGSLCTLGNVFHHPHVHVSFLCRD